MGYDSHYMLTFRKKEGTFTDEEIKALSEEITEASNGEEPDEIDHQGQNLFMGFYDKHWYDCLDDMAKVMKNHPEMSLHVIREGEDHNDTEKHFWRSGAQDWTGCSDIVLERPVYDEDTVFVAIIDPTNSSVSIACIPADADPEEYLEEIGNDCYWQKVDKMKFCGTNINL